MSISTFPKFVIIPVIFWLLFFTISLLITVPPLVSLGMSLILYIFLFLSLLSDYTDAVVLSWLLHLVKMSTIGMSKVWFSCIPSHHLLTMIIGGFIFVLYDLFAGRTCMRFGLWLRLWFFLLFLEISLLPIISLFSVIPLRPIQIATLFPPLLPVATSRGSRSEGAIIVSTSNQHLYLIDAFLLIFFLNSHQKNLFASNTF